MDPVSESKLTEAQKVIKNKFEEAYTNRIELEPNVDSGMESLAAASSSKPITNDLESTNNDHSLGNLSKTTSIYSNHKNTSESNKNSEEKNHDPNVLCDNLRMQIKSLLDGDQNSLQSINDILEEPHDNEILEQI